MIKKSLLFFSGIITILILNGCGGSATSIRGIAVDDLILNGTVDASNLDGSSSVSTRTSATDGSYHMNVDFDGIALLSVSCDAASMVLDSETGEQKSCEGVYGLQALAKIEKGREITANISPLTHIVFARAKALADCDEINASDIDEANKEVKRLFDVDVLHDSPAEGTYAKIVKSEGNL